MLLMSDSIRLYWYGFYAWLALWSVLLPLWHKHPVTARWWGQPGHGKAWLGKGAVKLTDGEVIRGAWVIGFSLSLKIECGWCKSRPASLMSHPKRLADVLGPINREPCSHSLQLPANFRVDYSSIDHSKKEDGISLCVLCMWYQLQGTRRDSWTRNRIRTSFLWLACEHGVTIMFLHEWLLVYSSEDSISRTVDRMNYFKPWDEQPSRWGVTHE